MQNVSRIIEYGSNWSITRTSSKWLVSWRLTYPSGEISIGPYTKGKLLPMQLCSNKLVLLGEEFTNEPDIEININGIITIYSEKYIGKHVNISREIIDALVMTIEKFNKSCITALELQSGNMGIKRSVSENNLNGFSKEKKCVETIIV